MLFQEVSVLKCLLEQIMQLPFVFIIQHQDIVHILKVNILELFQILKHLLVNHFFLFFTILCNGSLPTYMLFATCSAAMQTALMIG